MTDLTKLADALESYTGDGHGYQIDDAILREAARILRAAAGVDVAGLMTDRKIAVINFALHRFASHAHQNANAAGQDIQGAYYKKGAFEAFLKDAEDAEELLSKKPYAALESALRMALAAREGFVMVPVEPSKLDSQIHDSSSTHVHATVEAACWGEYTVEASRDDERSDWYITVAAPSGVYDYDGYWRNSAFKTVDDVINEAIRGACLMAIQEPPNAAAAPKGTP